MKSVQEIFMDYYFESKKDRGIDKYLDAVCKIEQINKVKAPFKNHSSFKSQVTKKFKK